MGVIIDFEHKANEVRFYIGDKLDGTWGDDFNRPRARSLPPLQVVR